MNLGERERKVYVRKITVLQLILQLCEREDESVRRKDGVDEEERQ